jgi:hypothetical protein
VTQAAVLRDPAIAQGIGQWGAMPRVVGDFNGDGRDDIALIGNSAWQYGRGRWY